MEKKTIIAVSAGTIAIVATSGILIKKFVFDKNKKDNKKQIVKIDDLESIDKLVHELASRNGIDLDDEETFIITSGIINWGIKNEKKEFTPEQFGDAAIWAVKNAGLEIAF